MKTIRDEDGLGIFMIPLFHQWGIRRCNVEGCTEQPSTIVTNPHPDISALGLCEGHYQSFKEAGEIKGTMVFDDYDAFKKEEVTR